MFKFIKLFRPLELVLLILVLVTIVVSEMFFFNDEPQGCFLRFMGSNYTSFYFGI